jgi:putative two-component system response regulator
LIQRAATMHDLGKIGIPDDILLKRGTLTPEEFDVMKTHTLIGAGILSGGYSDLTRMAELIATTHHERWDGSGYPQGLEGEAIPIAGRIVALADAFDALTHKRPYKKPWTVKEAVAEVQRQAGKQFDPKIVEAFSGLQATKEKP